MPTMRPDASEMTGTVREISGLTEPVTASVEGARCSTAVNRRKLSGWSTENRLALKSGTTFAAGGASDSAFTLSLLQPLMARDTIKIDIGSAGTFALLVITIFRTLLIPEQHRA